MGKTPDKICDRCGTPTSAASGRCAECRRQGELCAVCKTNWTGQSKFTTCTECRRKAMVDRLVAEGELERCPDCGGPMKAGHDKCWKCWTKERPEVCPKCGWRLKTGETCPREHRKPWETPEWKARRKEIIARTKACEWCQDPFAPPKNPPVVTRIAKPPRTGDVKADQEAYKAINDLEVQVVCKTCFGVWRKYRIRGRKDPRVVCPKCQGMKQPGYPTCYECSGKKAEVELRMVWDALEDDLHALIDESGCPKTCPEPAVNYVELDEKGRITGGGGHFHRCDIKKLEKEYPGMIREEQAGDQEKSEKDWKELDAECGGP